MTEKISVDRLLEGDVRLADTNPGISKGIAAQGRQRSYSEPADTVPSGLAPHSEAGSSAQVAGRTASAGSELPVSVASEVISCELTA